VIGANLPPSTILEYAGSALPAGGGFLWCDGAAYSRTTYAALFAAIGSTYGAGDGSTTFNVPDKRGRTSIGAGQGAGLTNRVLAAKGGEETHQLTIAELAAHTHTVASHAHQVGSNSFTYAAGGSGHVYSATNAPGGAAWNSGNTAPSTNSIGSDGAHNTMPPFLALNYIIKT
jgi:microcystin-dependent protein